MHDAPPARRAQVGRRRRPPLTWGADYPRPRIIRSPSRAGASCVGVRVADVRSLGPVASAPLADARIADTRVRRAPRFAPHPWITRSGAHVPSGRQAMARPRPSDASGCARSVRELAGMIRTVTPGVKESSTRDGPSGWSLNPTLPRVRVRAAGSRVPIPECLAWRPWRAERRSSSVEARLRISGSGALRSRATRQ